MRWPIASGLDVKFDGSFADGRLRLLNQAMPPKNSKERRSRRRWCQVAGYRRGRRWARAAMRMIVKAANAGRMAR